MSISMRSALSILLNPDDLVIHITESEKSTGFAVCIGRDLGDKYMPVFASGFDFVTYERAVEAVMVTLRTILNSKNQVLDPKNNSLIQYLNPNNVPIQEIPGLLSEEYLTWVEEKLRTGRVVETSQKAS